MKKLSRSMHVSSARKIGEKKNWEIEENEFLRFHK
jgi:hypothetical protein